MMKETLIKLTKYLLDFMFYAGIVVTASLPITIKMCKWSFFIVLMSIVRTIVYVTPAMLVVILVFTIAGLFSKVLSFVFEEAVGYKEENDFTI